jgi:hypothetical protein
MSSPKSSSPKPPKLEKNLNGSKGADTLNGNALDNVLQGKGGDDTLTGGDGNDTFKFEKSLAYNGMDTITDYQWTESVSVGGGEQQDILDLTAALKSFKKALKDDSDADIDDYVWLEEGEDGMRLMVDQDGDGGNAAEQWAFLDGLTADDLVRVRAFTASGSGSGSCSGSGHDLGDGYFTLGGSDAAEDDWADGYDDWDGNGGTMPAGTFAFDGTVSASGNIEVADDIDIFDPAASDPTIMWWNGVYEITVTGDLDTSKLTLDLLDGNGASVVTDPGNGGVVKVDFSVVSSNFALALDTNTDTPYQYFNSATSYFLAVASSGGATGSYNLSVKLVDDYVDNLGLIYGTGAGEDSTADLGFGSIQKTLPAGEDKAVFGLINYTADHDVWKYEGTALEWVAVNFTNPDAYVASNLQLKVYKSDGTELTPVDGGYQLAGTTYIEVIGTAAQAGSNYGLEVTYFNPV